MRQSDLACSWRAFRLPRRGNSLEEYEDAFAGDVQAGRFAVADGASASANAAPWARLLAEHFVQTSGPWSGWLPAARAAWQEAVAADDLPWYAEAKRAEGAFATLLGVALSAGPAGPTWEALAVGDSCLFHVRGDRLLRPFPVTRAADLGCRPCLLGSRLPTAGAAPATRRRTHGPWLRGDHLLLMTDALAGWFLRQVEAGRRPWQTLAGLADEQAFADRVEGLRDRGELANDDVTLVWIDGGQGQGVLA